MKTYKLKNVYKIIVSSEYVVLPERQTEKTYYIIADSEEDVKTYLEDYYRVRSRKILNMSFEKFDVLDLTEMIECEYGNIGSVSHYKKPDLDMYDGTFN